MKFLWIGPGMGENTQQEVLRRGGKLLSSFISQTNLVEGLDSLDIDMDTINGPKMDEKLFPIVPYEKWSRNGQSVDVCVSYKNIKYLNRITKEKELCKEIDKWLLLQKEDETIQVIVYNMHTAFLAAACRVKEKYRNTKIALIVPDLPQFMDLKMSRFKIFLKKIDWYRIQAYMKLIDKYILYSSSMAQFLKLKDDQWIVVEGSYNSEQIGYVTEKSGNISVMYSGVLDMRYGIPELLDAMELLDERFELWITGDGNARSLVEERVIKDKRIKYFGYLSSRQELLNKQASATMLISPRRDDEKASQYCFPSKIFEYMVSGRPVLSCFLKGIPEEYHEHLIKIEKITAESIAETVLSVAVMSEDKRLKIGMSAKDFVLNEKNKFVQAEKILRFISE